MAMKRVLASCLLVSFIIAGLSCKGDTARETVTLKFIKYNGDTYTEEVDINTKRIASGKEQVIRIEGLENLPSLTELDLSFFKIKRLGWMPKGLKKIWLWGNELEGVDGIEAFTSLEGIYLPGNKIKNIDPIFRSKTLKEVEVPGNEIEVVNCSDNESIEVLSLTGNNIRHIYNLHKVRKLRVLRLKSNPIEDDREEIDKLMRENPKVEIKIKEQGKKATK